MPIITILSVLLIYLLLNRSYLQSFKLSPLIAVASVNLIAEILALLIKYFLNSEQGVLYSSGPYNFSMGIELACYAMIFKPLFQNKKYKYFLNLFILVLPLLYIVILFTGLQNLLVLNNLIYLYECLFILITTLTFFIELFLADYFYTSPIKQFYFWLSTGLLLCYLGGALYLINEYEIFKISKHLNMILKSLLFYLNCFMYACILIAVQCLKKYPTLQIRSL